MPLANVKCWTIWWNKSRSKMKQLWKEIKGWCHILKPVLRPVWGHINVWPASQCGRHLYLLLRSPFSAEARLGRSSDWWFLAIPSPSDLEGIETTKGRVKTWSTCVAGMQAGPTDLLGCSWSLSGHPWIWSGALRRTSPSPACARCPRKKPSHNMIDGKKNSYDGDDKSKLHVKSSPETSLSSNHGKHATRDTPELSCFRRRGEPQRALWLQGRRYPAVNAWLPWPPKPKACSCWDDPGPCPT